MVNGTVIAKRGLTLATICASVFLMACSQLTPPGKNESENSAISSPTAVGAQLDSATTDDVVTGIEEAKLIVPFILNNLQSRVKASQDLKALWENTQVLTENDPACEAATHICLSIEDIQSEIAKADLVRAISLKVTADLLTKVEMPADLRASLNNELDQKLSQDPKNVLFPRVEVLYLNSQPTTGVLRNAISRVSGLITDESIINWNETCADLKQITQMGNKLSNTDDEKAQMLASLTPAAESIEASVKRITQNLGPYCETEVAGPTMNNSLYQNAESLRQELDRAIQGLDELYPSAKESRDLLRSFRL